MIWMFRTLIVSSMTVAACLSLAADETGIRTWPAPDGEALSEHYELLFETASCGPLTTPW